MKCVICRCEEVEPGTVTVTLERSEATIVVRSVPARICLNCGEQYLDEETSSRLLAQAEKSLRSGVQVEIREYRSA